MLLKHTLWFQNLLRFNYTSVKVFFRLYVRSLNNIISQTWTVDCIVHKKQSCVTCEEELDWTGNHSTILFGNSLIIKTRKLWKVMNDCALKAIFFSMCKIYRGILAKIPFKKKTNIIFVSILASVWNRKFDTPRDSLKGFN